jgi:hypothetical protein
MQAKFPGQIYGPPIKINSPNFGPPRLPIKQHVSKTAANIKNAGRGCAIQGDIDIKQVIPQDSEKGMQ